MLTGELVTLRGVQRDDVPQLHAWESAYATWPELNAGPWLPRPLSAVLAAYDGGVDGDYRAGSLTVPFAVTVAEQLVGTISLHSLDTHNRRGRLGIAMAPEARGKGYGTDACRVLLHYAFVDRGLHRVALDVLETNVAARRTYEKAGFVEEGRLEDVAWVRGRFVAEVLMRVLAPEFEAQRR